MLHRRRFLTHLPLGFAGAAIACSKSGPEASSTAPALAQAVGASRSAPLLKSVPAGSATLSWTPQHSDLVYTFGGAAPKHRIKSGTRIVTWTEDCYDGAVKTSKDVPSKVMTPGHDNPQTGPFFIEGAEPGDTVAVHLLKVEPARDYAVSSCGPGWGLLAPTDRTAILGPDLPEVVWRYQVDAAKTRARTTSQDARHTWEVPLAPFLGCLGVAPAMAEVRSTIVPGPFGGNMDCWEVRAGNTVFLGVNVSGAL